MTSDKYLELFKKRIEVEPEIPPSAFCESIFKIVSKGELHIPSYESEVSVCINNYILSIVRNYNPTAVRVIPIGENSYIFDEAKLIPVPTLEWRFAVIEIAFVLRKELGWLSKKIIYKTLGLIKKDYGFYLYSIIKNIVEKKEVSDDESFWWNTLLGEACDLFCEIDEYKNINKIDQERVKRLIEYVFSVFEYPWVDKDAVFLSNEIEEIMKRKPNIRRPLLRLKMMSVVGG